MLSWPYILFHLFPLFGDISTYQIPIHSTWANALQCSMNTQILWWQGSKQSWQLIDVTLIDSEWWSLTKESPHGTTPKSETRGLKMPADQERVLPNSGTSMPISGGLRAELISRCSPFLMVASIYDVLWVRYHQNTFWMLPLIISTASRYHLCPFNHYGLSWATISSYLYLS